MKKQDHVAILETLEEVDEVFWGPTNWDSARGGSKCGQYAATHCLKLPLKEAEKFSIQFANKHLQEYWKALETVETGYASFDFNTGKENTTYNRKVRHSDDMYLIAAKHIARLGADKFKIELINGENYRGIIFTNADDNSFTFKDTIDYEMVKDARKLHLSQQANKALDSMEQELMNFLGSN